MSEKPYSNRELDLKHNELKLIITSGFETTGLRLDGLAKKVEYTNGKVRRLYLIMTVVGSVSATMLITNGSDLVHFLMTVLL